MSAIAPAISSIYSVPSEWIGLKPAMVLFKKFAYEHIEDMGSLEEDELEQAIQKYREAAEIITNNLSKSSDLLEKYPEISEAFRAVNIGIKDAQRLHSIKRWQREGQEEKQRQQKLQNEEKRIQEVLNYQQYVRQEREKRGLKYGVPPVDNCNCPLKFPIRATDKTKRYPQRGIYYFQHERRGVEVYWCFASPEEAEAENFYRPLKNPPKQQPR